MSVWILCTTANPPKSDDKYAQKGVQLVRVSPFRSDFLQNPYFSDTAFIFSYITDMLEIGLTYAISMVISLICNNNNLGC